MTNDRSEHVTDVTSNGTLRWCVSRSACEPRNVSQLLFVRRIHAIPARRKETSGQRLLSDNHYHPLKPRIEPVQLEPGQRPRRTTIKSITNDTRHESRQTTNFCQNDTQTTTELQQLSKVRVVAELAVAGSILTATDGVRREKKTKPVVQKMCCPVWRIQYKTISPQQF